MSGQYRYPIRSKTKIDQTTNNSSTESSFTINMPSPDMEQSTMDIKELQHDDNQNQTNSGTHYMVNNTKISNEEKLFSFHPPQQPSTISSSAQVYSLQMELDILRKELAVLKLQQSQQQSNIQLVDHNSITATPMHIVINTDPLQQMKDFVKPFFGNSNDDVIKWIESIVHYFAIARVTGDKEQLYFQYAPAFLKEYAYKWWSEKKEGISNWITFKQLLIEQFDKRNEYLIEQQLDQRKQQLNEPVIKYYYDIMELCKKYDPNMSDKQKVRKLINGLRVSLYQDAIKETYTTPSEFLAKVQQLENIQKLIELRQTQDEQFDQAYSPDYNDQRPTSQAYPTQYDRQSTNNYNRTYSSSRNTDNRSNGPKVQCYSCGQWGHTARQCPQARRQTDKSNGTNLECYNCGQWGHIARHCQQDNQLPTNSQQYARSKNQ